MGIDSGCKVIEAVNRLENIMVILSNLDAAIKALDLQERNTQARLVEIFLTQKKKIEELEATIAELSKSGEQQQGEIDGLVRLVEQIRESNENFLRGIEGSL